MIIHARTARFLLGFTCLSGFALPAQAAFDPNEGADATPRASVYRPSTPLPASVVPRRYYAPTQNGVAAPMAVAPAVAMVPVATAAPVAVAPVTMAPAMAVRAVPVEQPNALAPMPATMPAPTMVADQRIPTPVTAQPYEPAPNTTHETRIGNKDRFSIGAEAYYDHYREDSVDLDDTGHFGSATASYDHYMTDELYAAIDVRGAMGSTDYKSLSGKIDGIDQWEIEGRLIGGYDYLTHSNGHFKTYLGLGTRYFSDELKGEVTDQGASGYDRRILQFYLPIGATYEFRAYGLQWAPNLEFDQFLYGHVQSRLQNIPGYQELNNNQHSGYGLRGEVMVGDQQDNGVGWQFGPFFRYWNIQDSDVDVTPSFTGIEPKNSRLQAGAKLKFLF